MIIDQGYKIGCFGCTFLLRLVMRRSIALHHLFICKELAMELYRLLSSFQSTDSGQMGSVHGCGQGQEKTALLDGMARCMLHSTIDFHDERL
jgi:hypothetical protein